MGRSTSLLPPASAATRPGSALDTAMAVLAALAVRVVMNVLSVMTVRAAMTVLAAMPALAAMPVLAATTPLGTDARPAAWVASWQASPQPVWAADFLFPTGLPLELRDQTVHQTARISLGGTRLRLVLANTYGDQPILVGRATVSRDLAEGAVGAGKDQGPRVATFSGRESAIIPPGASLISDPVELAVAALGRVIVSIHVPVVMPVTTFHWDGRQTAWLVAGDQTRWGAAGSVAGSAGPSFQSTTARVLLTGIDVETPSPARAVVVIGDSITDGAMASLDKDRRWPDFLAERLAPHRIAVVNAGISGARLLSDGMGVNALARFERDVLAQPGVRSVIVMLGINDIAWPGTAFAPRAPRPTLEARVSGYRQLIEQAHRRGVRIIGATLAPFEGALPDTPLANYYHADKDSLRRQLNDWIRRSGAFDAVIDFDAVLRDPANPARLAPRFDSGDRLHPGDAGNRAMADAVDLQSLLPAPGPGAERPDR